MVGAVFFKLQVAVWKHLPIFYSYYLLGTTHLFILSCVLPFFLYDEPSIWSLLSAWRIPLSFFIMTTEFFPFLFVCRHFHFAFIIEDCFPKIRILSWQLFSFIALQMPFHFLLVSKISVENSEVSWSFVNPFEGNIVFFLWVLLRIPLCFWLSVIVYNVFSL